MTRFHVFFGLLSLIVGVFLVAGCLYQDYVPNHDIILIKVTPTGTLEWSKTFDSGRNDEPTSVNQIADSGYYVLGEIADENHYGVNNIVLIKFSSIGDVLWTTTNMSSILAESNINGWDHEHNRSWLETYDNEKYGWIQSYSEMRENQGYLFPFVNDSQIFIVQLNRSGVLLNSTLAGQSTGSPPASIYSTQGAYVLLYFNTTNGHFESVRLDEKGNITKIQILLNATAHCIPATDGGYFCAGLQSDEGEKRINPFGGAKTKIMVKKMDAEGILIWEQPVITFCRPKYRDNIELTGIIQTSDRGYLIVGSRDNAYKC